MKINEIYDDIKKFYKLMTNDHDGSQRALVCIENTKNILKNCKEYVWFDLGEFSNEELKEFRKASEEVGWATDPSLKLPFPKTVFTYNVFDAKVAFSNPDSEVTHHQHGLGTAMFCEQVGEEIHITVAIHDATNKRMNLGANTCIVSKQKDASGIARWVSEVLVKNINSDYSKPEVLNYLDSEMAQISKMVIDYVLNLLTCKNICIEVEAPNAKLNKKRLKKGLFPATDKRTIKVVGGAEEVFRYASGGTHRSPCIHLRRGHVRRLSSGETTWVRACVVGKTGKILETHYEVKAA